MFSVEQDIVVVVVVSGGDGGPQFTIPVVRRTPVLDVMDGNTVCHPSVALLSRHHP